MSAFSPSKRKMPVKERLRTSANGYVQVRRFANYEKAELRKLIEAGEVEIFDSPLGRAYRLKK